MLLINFTGIGCGACQAAVPFLKELKGKFSNEDFDLIAIEGWSRKEHSIQVYANNKKLNYTILNANDQVIKDYQTGNAAPSSSYWTNTTLSEKLSGDMAMKEQTKKLWMP